MKSILLSVALAASVPAEVALAQASDPAAVRIQAFDAALIDIMKQAKSLGVEGRYRKLSPTVEQMFDLPTMTRFAVGPKWATLSSEDQAALIKAFTRLTVASYAHNFDDFGGERFVLDPNVATRGPDKLVRTQIVSPGSKSTDLAYRMRQATDGRWKVIDVYYNGSISELTTRRSDFASTINSGGARDLLKKIDALSDKLMKGG